LTQPLPAHQKSLCNAIGMALMAAGIRLGVPTLSLTLWPEDYDPGARALRDAESGSLPSDPRQWFNPSTVPDSRCWPPRWPSARRAYRELVKLIELARDIVAKAELDPNEVRAMLAEAGAPMPAADDLARLAADCLTLALIWVFEQALYQRGLGPSFDWNNRKRGWRKVNEAAETLRQHLPEVIKELKFWGYSDRIPPIRRMLNRLDELDLTMPIFGPRRRRWAEGAVSLAKTYSQTVDPGAGWSREGPAVQFFVLALSRAYQQEITGAAIATELDRRRDEIPISGGMFF
jgi:hypothetical protein